MNRHTAFTVIIVAVTFALSLAAIEGILRLKNSAQNVYDIEMWRYSKELKRPSADPVLGHEHVPGSRATLQNTDIRINAMGMRGPEVPPAKPGQRRILVLGSSITLGWGVAEKDILTSRLEQKFKAAGQDVVVMNGGIGNYNAARYIEWFLTRLKATEPTDVVVHYFVNDAEKLEAGGGNFLLRHSELAVTLWIVANRLLGPTGAKSLLDHYHQVYEPDQPGYQAMVAALKKLSEYAAAHGIRLYLAMMPDIHNLTNYPFGFIHDRMKDLAAKDGYRYVDLLPAFQGLDPKTVWAMPGDPHPNALGHRLMADALYPVLASPAE